MNFTKGVVIKSSVFHVYFILFLVLALMFLNLLKSKHFLLILIGAGSFQIISARCRAGWEESFAIHSDRKATLYL